MNISKSKININKVGTPLKDSLGYVSDRNNHWLKKLHNEAGMTIAAWGTHGKYLDRGHEVTKLLDKLYCLRITKEGFPSHPLYLPSTLKPIKYI